jgi:3-(3-hydroxy-phenyl)propionate hydroxylase
MTEHAVAIVGGGPTGLMLAGELALAGIDVAIVERRANQELAGSRAGGLHSRTIEILDQRGIADRFVSQGTKHQQVHFHVPLNLSDFPTRHNYVLGLFQNHIERIMAEWVGELRVPIYRGCEATDFAQDGTGVDVTLSDGRSLRAQYLAGCDGGRSLVRKIAGIEFAGWDPTTSWLIAEASTAEEPKWGFHQDAVGIHAIGKGDNGGVRIVLTERRLRLDGEPTLRDVSEMLLEVYGTNYGIHSPTWISRFTDMTRQAATYRDRRVLLAGDAAHVHPPVGGQGLNIGVQDAMNLGWKLAQVVKRTAPDSLLDTYHAERFPVAARVLRNTMAQVALRRTDDRTKAAGEFFSEFLGMEEPRKRFTAEMSGLGVHYDLGSPELDKEHPLLGRRMPDLDLITANGTQRVFTLLHDAKPVLLNLGEPGGVDIARWADRVRVIDASYEGAWELPALGTVAAPAAVLVRPDGYVAWVGDQSQRGLADALTKWFGPPAAAAFGSYPWRSKNVDPHCTAVASGCDRQRSDSAAANGWAERRDCGGLGPMLFQALSLMKSGLPCRRTEHARAGRTRP